MNLLVLIMVAVVGIALGVYFGRRDGKGTFAKASPEERKRMQKESRKALSERTEDRKERIIDLLTTQALHKKDLEACGLVEPKNGATRRDVEKLLNVASNTARKYLNELESEHKIIQIGERGPDVYYALDVPKSG